MGILFIILLATFIVSLGSLIGIFTLRLQEERLSKILIFLVALSAGALLGGAFLHLMPEALEGLSGSAVFTITLLSFILFFFIEKVLHWHHCHKGHCDIHAFGYLNLAGDAIHNFIDGVIIAAAFLVDIKLGLATSLAVALHEIPQEISDYGVLLYSGFSKYKALWANFMVALTAILGGVAGYFLATELESALPYLLAFAAGSFIYISTSDLIPEIRKEEDLKKSIKSFGVFLFGVLLMFATKLLDF
ncbi:ZIP family metal transporter [Candidatus Parcubacteria bacterium]|nr:MAG: ZIP family metal transporter [Candidatus Parcubacteria bacterium]